MPCCLFERGFFFIFKEEISLHCGKRQQTKRKKTAEEVQLYSIKLKVLNNIIDVMEERTVIKVNVQILCKS